MTELRKVAAKYLRRVHVSPIIGFVEDHLFALQSDAFRLAEALDPAPLDWSSPEADAFDLQAFAEEVMKPQQEAMSAAISRMLARMEPYPLPFEIPHAFVEWSDPAPKTREVTDETMRLVGLAMDQPAVQYDTSKWPRVVVDSPKFDRFPDTDVRPYLEQIDTWVKDMARQHADARERPMVEWLEDVGTVVPGFGPDAAREIVRRRDDIMGHPLAGGEIDRAGD